MTLHSAGLRVAPLAFAAVWLAGTVVAGTLGLPTLIAPHADRSELVALGRKLFFDQRLSAHGKMSCATCHDPTQGFTENRRKTPRGADGRALRRNTPSLLNVAFAASLMHDGAAPSLEVQIFTPLFDSNEMANADAATLERRLSDIEDYSSAFQTVFGEMPRIAAIGKALAAYQRTLVSGNSAFDRWKFGGDSGAVSSAVQRGFAIFSGKGGCSVCHTVGDTTALFTDNDFHNTGVAASRNIPVGAAGPSRSSTIDFAAAGDRGRHEVTQKLEDVSRFRTPTLRNVALTAPYMHDGSFATLTDVVRFYSRGGGPAANLDPAIKPLGLDDIEVQDLVAFLESLTGDNVHASEAEQARLSRAAPQ